MKNLLGISFQLYPLPVDNNVPSECGVKFLLFIKMIIFQYFAVLLLPMSAGHNFLFIARAKKNIYEFQIRFTRISKFFFKYSKYFKNIKNLKLRAFGIHFSWISCQKKISQFFKFIGYVGLLPILPGFVTSQGNVIVSPTANLNASDLERNNGSFLFSIWLADSTAKRKKIGIQSKIYSNPIS